MKWCSILGSSVLALIICNVQRHSTLLIAVVDLSPAQNRFTAQHEADIKDLATVLCLSNKEATEIRLGVAANLYKKLLREEVTSRRCGQATQLQLCGLVYVFAIGNTI